MRTPFRALLAVCALFLGLSIPSCASPLTVYYTAYDNFGTSYIGDFTVNGTKLFEDLANPGRYTLNITSFENFYDGTVVSSGGKGNGSTLNLFPNGSFNLLLLTDPISLFVPRKNNGDGDAYTCFTDGCSFSKKVDGIREFFSFIPATPVADTPEPSSLLLMGTGTLLLCAFGYRHRRIAPVVARPAQRL